MYESYREWVARVIRRGVQSGEFREVDPDEVADLAMALFDGLGVRALIRDPAMSLDRARRIAAERLGPSSESIRKRSSAHRPADLPRVRSRKLNGGSVFSRRREQGR